MLSSTLPLTKENVENHRIHEIDTWPYLPRGLLKETGKEKDFTDQLTRWAHSEYERLQYMIECYKERQRASTSWILAAGISILGNLIISLLFSAPNVVNVNLDILLFSMIFFFVLLFSLLHLLSICKT